MASDIQGVIDVWGPGAQVRLMLRPDDVEGKRRLIRGKAATLLHFGLDALDPVPTSYSRNGGIHIGKYQYGNTAASWHTIKVVIPEVWPSGRKCRAWGFSINKPWNNTDLCELAEHIDRSGVPWLGFYDHRNCWLMKRPLRAFQQLSGSAGGLPSP